MTNKTKSSKIHSAIALLIAVFLVAACGNEGSRPAAAAQNQQPPAVTPPAAVLPPPVVPPPLVPAPMPAAHAAINVSLTMNDDLRDEHTTCHGWVTCLGGRFFGRGRPAFVISGTAAAEAPESLSGSYRIDPPLLSAPRLLDVYVREDREGVVHYAIALDAERDPNPAAVLLARALRLRIALGGIRLVSTDGRGTTITLVR